MHIPTKIASHKLKFNF